jgi:hypothetical protein
MSRSPAEQALTLDGPDGPLEAKLSVPDGAPSALAVARGYADVLDAWLVDDADVGLVDDVRALGIRCTATDTIMRDVEVATAVARAALGLLETPVDA